MNEKRCRSEAGSWRKKNREDRESGRLECFNFLVSSAGARNADRGSAARAVRTRLEVVGTATPARLSYTSSTLSLLRKTLQTRTLALFPSLSFFKRTLPPRALDCCVSYDCSLHRGADRKQNPLFFSVAINTLFRVLCNTLSKKTLLPSSPEKTVPSVHRVTLES